MKQPAIRFLALIALITGAQSVRAKVKATCDCPTVVVSCPDTGMSPTLNFTVNVSGADLTAKYTFNWTVSAGVITGGQGTPSITVDTAGFEGQSTTATVVIGGFPRLCSNEASCTTANRCGLRSARKVDEYADITFEEEKPRLEKLAAELQNDPAAQGYLLSYGGKRAYEGEAQRRGEKDKNYLVRKLGIEKSRLVVIDGGYREERTVELFVVPSGSTPPAASPTVDPKEVEILVERKSGKGSSQ